MDIPAVSFLGRRLFWWPIGRKARIANRFVACLLLLCVLFLSGCTVFKNVASTVILEPAEYSWKKDRKQSLKVYRQWAEQEWRRYCLQERRHHHRDFEAGFKDGFVDYVYAGGSGEPPPIPPRRLWNVEQRNPRGHQAATEWFAGYRLGADLAGEAGYRERATLQSSLFLFGPCEDCSAQDSSYLESNPRPLPAMVEPAEEMPRATPLPEPTLPVPEAEDDSPPVESSPAEKPEVDPEDLFGGSHMTREVQHGQEMLSGRGRTLSQGKSTETVFRAGLKMVR